MIGIPDTLAELMCGRAVMIVGMEILESIGWVALGFMTTIVAMELAWRISKRRLTLAHTGVN